MLDMKRPELYVLTNVNHVGFKKREQMELIFF